MKKYLILALMTIFVSSAAHAARSCSWLSGRDYDVCKVYKDGRSCTWLSGRDYDRCKVYEDVEPIPFPAIHL